MHRRIPCIVAAAACAGLSPTVAAEGGAAMHDAAALEKLVAPFAPVELTADVSALPESEQRALGKLVEAAQVMDAIFLRQVWSGNEPLLLALAEDATKQPSALARARMH